MNKNFRKLHAAILVCLLVAGCGDSRQERDKDESITKPANAPERVAAEQVNPVAEPPELRLISELPQGDWVIPPGDYANTRYSPLDEINIENAKDLKMAFSVSTGIPHGHEGQPLVVNDTLYIVTPFPNKLIAVNLADPGGPFKFVYNPHPDERAVGVACCDVVNRGASYKDGRIYYAALDTTVVCVDAETGEEIWRNKIGNPNRGETTTMAALVVKDKVLVGNSGGELGVRGKLTALDLDTGEIAWMAYHTGSDEDCLIGEDFDPFYEKDEGEDLGLKTWPPDQWKLGGGTQWGWISYDPELDLIYYGTGNPGVWNPDLRPGDNKWSCTIWARDPDDGYARWAYQVTPHDSWDYDEIMENVLVDMEWEGEMRKLLFHPARNGFMLVMDRVTGELLSAETFQPVNWATGYDLQTGYPNIVAEKRVHMGKVTEEICPSSTGAKEFVPSAFSPRTGLLYIPCHNTCMNYGGIEANYIAGTPYLGASVRMYPGPGDYQGELVAWDVKNQRKVWGIKDEKWPIYSGVLATAGDVVFYGTMTGWFRAVHAWTGEILWEIKLGSGIVGNPMTYIGPDGKQYIAIYAGIGGWMGSAAFPSRSTEDEYALLGAAGAMKGIQDYTAPGDTMYVFSR